MLQQIEQDGVANWLNCPRWLMGPLWVRPSRNPIRYLTRGRRSHASALTRLWSAGTLLRQCSSLFWKQNDGRCDGRLQRLSAINSTLMHSTNTTLNTKQRSTRKYLTVPDTMLDFIAKTTYKILISILNQRMQYCFVWQTWKNFSIFPLTWWMSIASFIEIPPITKIGLDSTFTQLP